MGNTGKRYTREEIIEILKEAGAENARVSDVLHRRGVAPKTYYRWKAKYGATIVTEASRLRALEAENMRLKRIVADQMLNIHVLKELLERV